MKKSRFIIGFIVLLILSAFYFNPLPVPEFIARQSSSQSITLFSREGVELRKTLSSFGGRRQSANLDEVNPTFLKLLIQIEDRRFFGHTGFDVPAQIRAVLQYLKAGRVVSGASTITMQLVRLSRPTSRTFLNKITEMTLAMYLEMSLSKEQILTQYLNHLPFGNEIYGVAEASQVYFKKSPKDLSLVESALLVGLIRAPEAFNPLKNPGQLQAVAFRILSQAGHDMDALNKELISTRFYRPDYRFKAPHFSDFVLKRLRAMNADLSQSKIKTSLDLQLNDEIDLLVNQQIQSLTKMNVNQASVLVVQNITGEIVGYVGSKNYWDDFSQGMIDGVHQYRQPGSTLKPFTYALALDSGMSPSAMLADVQHQYESEIGDYIPMNYDRRFRGPVLVRQALANSLNVPAVEVLQRIGVSKFYGLLKKLNFEGLTETPDHYGLGLTLGNVETSLMELVRAYSVFARGGRICDFTVLAQKQNYKCTDDLEKSSGAVFSNLDSALIVRNFLSDDKARRLVFGNQGPLNFDFPVMVKTGTSQNYRDNWTIAVTPKYTIGVWVGNFNGDAMQGVSGVTGAAPIANAIVNLLHERDPWFAWSDQPQLKKTNVCALSGQKPNKSCPHIVREYARTEDLVECAVHELIRVDRRTGGLAGEGCSSKHVRHTLTLNLPDVYHLWQLEQHPETLAPTQYSSLCEMSPDRSKARLVSKKLRILRPQDGDIFKIDKHRPAKAQVLSLKTTHPHENLIIEMDQNISHSKALQTLTLTPTQASAISLRPGKHRLRVRSSTDVSLSDEVVFWVR